MNPAIPIVLEDLAAGGARSGLPHLLPQVVHHTCLVELHTCYFVKWLVSCQVGLKSEYCIQRDGEILFKETQVLDLSS